MFREPEGKKMFETDNLAADTTDADEMNMDIQKGYGTKDTSGTLSSVNPPISVAAPKPFSSKMNSRYFFPIKMSSFAQSNVYPTMPLKAPAPFGGGIKSKAVTPSLSGEGSSLKAGSFWWWVRCLFQNKRIRRNSLNGLVRIVPHIN